MSLKGKIGVMSTRTLLGKVAFVTGSAGGLGLEFAKRLLASGVKVALSDVKENVGLKEVDKLRAEFGTDNVCFIVCNVTKQESLDNAFNEAIRFFKCNQLDILVNNAGVMGEKEGWKLCMDINLQGVLLGSNLAFESKMSKLNGGTGGVIINVASILGLFNAKQPKGWAYNTSKSAVVTYTRCIGTKETLKDHGIKVMCICPSVASTPILDGCTKQELEDMEKNVGGFMTPKQVGEAFINLLKDGSTGSVMAVWKDCPAYCIPDMAFNLFVLFTTCSMIFRYVPGYSSKNVIGPIHMVIAVFGIILIWILMGKFSFFLMDLIL